MKEERKKKFKVLFRRRKIKRNRKRIQVVAQFIPPDRGDIINGRRLENLIPPRDHRESVIFTREISPNLDRYLARTGPLIRNVRSGYGNRVTPRKRTFG